MVRSQCADTAPACRRCGLVSSAEHIEVHTMYGPWDGYIMECGCREIVRGSRAAVLKEWKKANK